MKVSLNWVKEYTKIILPPDELKERISVSLTEVENIEHFEERFKNIVTAEVKKVEKHPTSEALLVVKLDIGEKEVSVVIQKCGVKEGDKVPFLFPGTAIPGEIGSISSHICVECEDVKGVTSEGMVPSGRELGLNNDHTTVYQLPSEVKAGTPLCDTLDLTDVIFEIENKALTHRQDVFSVEGFAREVAAIQHTPYKGLAWLQSWDDLKPKQIEERLPIEIVNQAKALCPRYMVVVLDNITVGPSPKWMQIRLAKVGIRPVNNVVDISNYLMVEVGQPSHAFDYDKVVQKDPSFNGIAKMVVRMATGGERITTIEGDVHELQSDMMVNSDSAHPIGIAGVMGGKDTEIGDETKRVIFQVENFNMYSIRKTSWKLGIFSDAAARFSRGLDPNRCEPVMYKGIQMLQELAGASIASSVQDSYEMPVKVKSLSVSPESIRKKIGSEIPDEEIEAILKSLGLGVIVDKKNEMLTLSVPTFRRDLSLEEDIVEEVVRIFGFDKVTPTLPKRNIVPVMMNPSRSNRMLLKNILAASGSHEIYTYSFVGTQLYDDCGLELDAAHKLRNPLSPEMSYMRPLLLPSVLEKYVLNASSYKDFSLFEVDKINPLNDLDKDLRELPPEPWHLALVHSTSYYHAKQALENLLSSLHVANSTIVPTGQIEVSKIPSWVRFAQGSYNLSRTGYVEVNDEIVGLIGQISSEVCAAMEIDEGVSAFELNFDSLDPYISDIAPYKNPSKYPSVTRDLCFVCARSVPYKALEKALRSAELDGYLLEKIECLDIYVDDKNPDEKKITFRVTLRSDEATLTDEMVTKEIREIVGRVERSTGARLLGEIM